MRHDKLGRELELIILLTRNADYTAQDLCEKLGVTRRNLYYYLDFLRYAGFEVIKHGYYYRLGRRSRFFTRLREGIDFTENEAVFIRSYLISKRNSIDSTISESPTTRICKRAWPTMSRNL